MTQNKECFNLQMLMLYFLKKLNFFVTRAAYIFFASLQTGISNSESGMKREARHVPLVLQSVSYWDKKPVEFTLLKRHL